MNDHVESLDLVRQIRFINAILLAFLLAFGALSVVPSNIKPAVFEEFEHFKKDYRDLRTQIRLGRLAAKDEIPDEWWTAYRGRIVAAVQNSCGCSIELGEGATFNTVIATLNNSAILPPLDDAKNLNNVDQALRDLTISVKSLGALNLNREETAKLKKVESSDLFRMVVVKNLFLDSPERTNTGKGSVEIEIRKSGLSEKLGNVYVTKRGNTVRFSNEPRIDHEKSLSTSVSFTWVSSMETLSPFVRLIYTRSPEFIEWWEQNAGVSARRLAEIGALTSEDTLKNDAIELFGVRLRGKGMAFLLPIISVGLLCLLSLYQKALIAVFLRGENGNKGPYVFPWIGMLPGSASLVFSFLLLVALPVVINFMSLLSIGQSSFFSAFVLTILVLVAALISFRHLLVLRTIMLTDDFSKEIIEWWNDHVYLPVTQRTSSENKPMTPAASQGQGDSVDKT